jgi:prophage tail gpP-like protein
MIYTKVMIDGTEYYPEEVTVERNIGKFNASSNFTMKFNNYKGDFNSTFNLNDEVIIYADLNTTPATTKVFTGIIEDMGYSGNGLEEELELVGRDYGAVLQDITVQPSIQRNRDIGAIAKSIVIMNADDIVTGDNMETNTGITIEQISFNHKNLFDSLQELAELAGYYFYVDEEKDVHFEINEGISSGETFDNSNILNSNFKVVDDKIFNKVWVYGSRILTGATNSFNTSGGSIFTTDYKPHNTNVYVNSTLQQPGGIYQMNNPAHEEVKYLVNFNERQIIFTSGTKAGDNIPASGDTIDIDYERNVPLLAYKEDTSSISNYGPKVKIITDNNIKDYNSAVDKATSFLDEYKEPKIQGDIDVKGIINITPGNTCIVDIPFHNINTQTYTILSASYNFTPENNFNDSVLHLTLNKKIIDFTDVMKEQVLKIQNFETGPLEGELTRLETSLGSVVISSHYEVWTNNVGSNFIFDSGKHGLLDDSNSTLAYMDAGSQLNTSGGDF